MNEIMHVSFAVNVRKGGYSYSYRDPTGEAEIEMDIPGELLTGGLDFAQFLASLVPHAVAKYQASVAEEVPAVVVQE